MNRHHPRPNFPNRRRPWTKYNQQDLVPGQFFISSAAAPAPAPRLVHLDRSLNQISLTDVEASLISIRLQTPRSPDADTILEFIQQTLQSHESSSTDSTTRLIIVNQRQGFRTRRRNPQSRLKYSQSVSF